MVEHLEGLLRTLDPEYDKGVSRSNTSPFVESVWSDITPRPGQAQINQGYQAVMPGTLLDTPQQSTLPVHTINEGVKSPLGGLQTPALVSMPAPIIPVQEGTKGKLKEKQTQKKVEASEQVKMPEATIPSTFQRIAGQMMPEVHVVKSAEAVAKSAPLMSMPEAIIPQKGTIKMPEAVIPPQKMPIATIPNEPIPMPIPSVPLTNTPIPTIGAVVPPSTYDPDSLPAPTWTATQTPRTTGEGTRSMAERNFSDRITTMLELLPLLHRDGMSKEELADAVMRAMGEGGASNQDHHGERDKRENLTHLPASSALNLGYTTSNNPYATSGVMTDNEWFQINGGGLLPSGWSAHFDYEIGLWYFCNYNDYPPTATWQDPRGAVSMPAMLTVPVSAAPPPTSLPTAVPPPMPLPISMPQVQPPNPVTSQDADWLSARFGALQAQKEVTDGNRGVVSAELHREEREAKDLNEAIKVSREAVEKANAAIAKGDAIKYQSAQEDMIRARGIMDRLNHEAQLRNAMIPPAMINYQGINRGYDHNPAYLRPRTYYTDQRPSYFYPQQMPQQGNVQPYSGMPYPPTMAGATSFSGRIMGKFIKPRIPNSAYMPTAWPIPPEARFKASSTPTPYSMPEFCFAWDMLLRSQRDPYAAAAMRY